MLSGGFYEQDGENFIVWFYYNYCVQFSGDFVMSNSNSDCNWITGCAVCFEPVSNLTAASVNIAQLGVDGKIITQSWHLCGQCAERLERCIESGGDYRL